MITPEGVTKTEIKALLDSYGDELYYFMPVQSGIGARTIDVLICFRGLFFAVEAKRKGGRAQKFQERIMNRVRDANGEALCVDKIDELKALLDYVARHEVKLSERPPLKRRPDGIGDPVDISFVKADLNRVACPVCGKLPPELCQPYRGFECGLNVVRSAT